MKQDGQLFFDIFDTDGFVGDMLLVNGSYYPYFEVLPRRYRFRILNASMSRFIKLALAVNKSLEIFAGNACPLLLHRKRRQLRRQSDPDDAARRAGRGRAL